MHESHGFLKDVVMTTSGTMENTKVIGEWFLDVSIISGMIRLQTMKQTHLTVYIRQIYWPGVYELN